MEPRSDGSLLPVHSPRAAAPEAYQRAPTLMAAEGIGCQGEVQVWSPDETLLSRRARRATISGVVYVSSPLLFGAFIHLAFQGALGWHALLISTLLFLLIYGCTAMVVITHMGSPAARRRPRYLTTDDTGIGITTDKASRYVRWHEIISALNIPWGSEMRLWTGDNAGAYAGPNDRHSAGKNERIRLNLSGYPTGEREAIWKLIADRANLVPCAAWHILSPNDWRVREGYTVDFKSGKIIPLHRALHGAPRNLQAGNGG